MQQVGVGGILAKNPHHRCGVRPGALACARCAGVLHAGELVPLDHRETLGREKKKSDFLFFCFTILIHG